MKAFSWQAEELFLLSIMEYKYAHREEQKITLPDLMLFHEGDILSACHQKFASHVLASMCLPEFMWGGGQKRTKSGLRTENHFNP